MDSKENMPTPKRTHEIITAAILGFEEQKRRIDLQITDLHAMLSGDGAEPAAVPESSRRPRRKMSAAARKKIGAAQRKRWAEAKATSQPESPARPKRKLSAAGRAAIIAATKRRWAVKRAAAKK
jgi:hypothetical protein